MKVVIKMLSIALVLLMFIARRNSRGQLDDFYLKGFYKEIEELKNV